MTLTPEGELDQALALETVAGSVSADQWMAELGKLLGELEAAASAADVVRPVISDATDGRLVQMRLGTAASLFAALRCKHAASASHALRVALTCSAWSTKIGLAAEECDAIEIAALLHDMGVVGVPDRILLKPGPLELEEAAVMARARGMSLDVLRAGCQSPAILSIVENVGAWFDGSREQFKVSGRDIPLGARMIAIAEAFDAMTTDKVYRPARSHERAMAELFRCAGSQFDPDLVQLFAAFHAADFLGLQRETAQRWLQSLDPELANAYWELGAATSPIAERNVATLFQNRLLENMYDAVLFIDASSRVRLWNRGAERLTGIAGQSILQTLWTPELLGMTDEKGVPIKEADCPVHCSIRSGVQSLRRLGICDRSGRAVAVHAHAIPVTGADGVTLGAILLFHDASSEISLEQRCQALHEKATKDPLTQVANRAEFDRVHEMFIAAHRQQQVPCSLIMCDLDRFKLVNDTYGHQAGDEAIKSLAGLLRSSCRPGDLVARYGGEEFVILCADTDNAAATRRAEQIRKALCQIPQPPMGGRTISASFGVTEVQPGDTPETMLHRADRALLMAKERGRNMVIQLGVGSESEDEKTSVVFFGPPPQNQPAELLEQDLVTPVPLRMAIEKLRGFVADHRAKVVAVDGDTISMELAVKHAAGSRRAADRTATLVLDVRLYEERPRKGEQPQGTQVSRTRIHVIIRLQKSRDRRRENMLALAQEVLRSFRSYLMAAPEESPPPPTEAKRSLADRLLSPLLGRKHS